MRCKYFASLLILSLSFISADKVLSQQAGGFGGYVTPNGSNSGQSAGQSGADRQVPEQTLPAAQPMQIPSVNNAQSAGTSSSGSSSNGAPQQTSNSAPSGGQGNGQSGYIMTETPNTQAAVGGAQQANTENGEKILPPPFELLKEEQARLDEFLIHWEAFGKDIKRISCDVHVRDYDGGVFHQNSKVPMAHTWGEFRFIAPNKLSYHVRGEFVYIAPPAGGDPKPEWKPSSNEKKIVFDGKNLVQYNFQKKEVHFFPIPEEESDYDLSMNKMFPLFFIANAEKLKMRYYMRIVTPAEKVDTDVWIEAFPRYASDQQMYRSLLILLRLNNLQPYYLRRMSQNGKSYSDLEFQSMTINKGLWNIEPNVDLGWSKKVEDPVSMSGKEPEKTKK